MNYKDKLDEILLKVQKPSCYVGGELNSVVKNKEEVDFRFAFCFPDTYEIGMSHLGMKILYSLLNKDPHIWCERVFAPAADMEEQMRQRGILLYGLESLEPIKDCDMIGFTMQYELSYTNVLNMLDLAGVPVLAGERPDLAPLVVAGGPCVCNPEPLVDFVDLFMPGEGEEVLPEICALFREYKRLGKSKEEYLRAAAQIEGVYVPSLYDVAYHEDGTVKAITAREGAPNPVKKRIIQDLDKVFYPEEFVVPFSEIVHDRAMVEVLRGCIRGCRFCQAGFIYRPFREKSHDTLNRDSRSLCDSTGYDEVSLTSLSTSDYSEIEPLLDDLLSWSEEEKVNLSLPSLRIDNFSEELIEKISRVKKSGLTFAPEAGTQRLRDVINKNIDEKEIFDSCRLAFAAGYTSVKLYFMMGLPTETMEDIGGIIDLAQRIVGEYHRMPNRPAGKAVHVSVSVAVFVPKPFTPFEFEPQDTREQVEQKVRYLLDQNNSRKISVKYHDFDTSFLEAVLARGDRRLSPVVYKAWQKGCHFDSWQEHFHFDRWMEAMAECGLDPAFYANRARPYEEISPWSHLDYFIDKSFLIRENKLAHEAVTTPHCRKRCAGCGANRLKGGVCFEKTEDVV